MNVHYLVAAALSGLTALAHVVLGGPELIPALEAGGLSAYEVALSLMLFHITTILLVVNALFLALAGFGRPLAGAVALIAVVCAGIGLAFLWQGIVRLGNVRDMPQWLVLGLICAALWLGWRRERRGGNQPGSVQGGRV